jgi:hypothetical protein
MMKNTEKTLRDAEVVGYLLELADELDKGINGDLNWLKYMGPLVREAADVIQTNITTK